MKTKILVLLLSLASLNSFAGYPGDSFPRGEEPAHSTWGEPTSPCGGHGSDTFTQPSEWNNWINAGCPSSAGQGQCGNCGSEGLNSGSGATDYSIHFF